MATPKPLVQLLVEDHDVPLRAAVACELARQGQSFSSWSRAVGYPQSQVSSVLGGKSRSPYGGVRDAIARAFGISRAWLDKEIERAQNEA